MREPFGLRQRRKGPLLVPGGREPDDGLVFVGAVEGDARVVAARWRGQENLLFSEAAIIAVVGGLDKY